YGEDVDSFDGYEYLFWVGCAGAYDDKAKKTTKAVAELLAVAGVKYLVLGTGETCNGDSARRSGNEFLFQQLAAQAVETLDGVYDAPRELIGAAGATLTEMPRHAERSFCCGAGGARMWMEEHIGKRINHERVDEALATGAAAIATGCPFCRVMVTDGVNDRQEEAGRSGVEVLDVAQILLGSLEYDKATLPEKGTAAKEASDKAERAPKAE